MFKLLSCLVICFAFSVLTIQNCYAQIGDETTKKILETRFTLVLDDVDEELFLTILSRRVKLPLGFYQLYRNGEEKKKININLRQGTLREALEEFVKVYPQYRWEILNGVINVVPQELPEILGISISKVDFKDMQLVDAEFAIFELPEIASSLERLDLIASKITTKYGNIKKETNFSLKMESATVQEILNEIIRNKYGNYWTIEQFGVNLKNIRISLS